MNDDRFQARTITIASVYPMRCEATRDYGNTQAGGRTIFVLEPAPKGGFATLTVSDMWQRIQDIDAMNASGRQVQKAFWVDVESLARDLHAHWAMQRIGTASGFRPGIKIIAGSTPTQAELDEMNAVQRGYFEGLYHEAQGLAAKFKHRDITDTHREAARWLGLDAPWVANIGASHDWKECQSCFEKINAKATVCRVCRSEQPNAVKAPAKQPLPPPVKTPAQVAA